MKILKSSDDSMYNTEYLFYLLQTIHIISDTHKRFWISEYAPLKVKVHIYSEQLKIVDYIEHALKN